MNKFLLLGMGAPRHRCHRCRRRCRHCRRHRATSSLDSACLPTTGLWALLPLYCVPKYKDSNKVGSLTTFSAPPISKMDDDQW